MEDKYTNGQKAILHQGTKDIWGGFMAINKIAPELVTPKANKAICNFISKVDFDTIKKKR